MKQKLQLLENMTPIDYKIQSIQYSSYASQVYEELQKCIHNKQQ